MRENYSLGELIVPQKYRKVVLNDDLSLSDVDIEISGRKISLKSMRKKINFKHKDFFRIHTDNQLEVMTKLELTNETC